MSIKNQRLDSQQVYSTAAINALRQVSLENLLILGQFSPIPDCLIWRLCEMYWAQVGSEAFTGGEVPYTVTNDGTHAGDAAHLFVQSALAAELAGDLEDELLVLELGVGSGLFGKLFLDQLQEICARDQLDYYDRTRYIASDGSATMLDDLVQTGVFADHAKQIKRLHLPLPGVEEALHAAGRLGQKLVGSVRAIHANYLLDSLPTTILSLEGEKVWELEARGRIAADDFKRLGLVGEDSKLDVEAIGMDLELLEMILKSLVLETRYVPTDRSKIACGSSVPTSDPATGTTQFLHSYGALTTLDEVLPLLRPGGYVLMTDYGYPRGSEQPEVFEPQNFGRSITCAVNFEQIETRFAEHPVAEIFAPKSDPEDLQTRLVGRDVAAPVVAQFRERFCNENWEMRQAPLKEAISLADQGRFEAARWKYEQLLRGQPFSWHAHEMVAAFLTYTLEEYEAGIIVAQSGLQLNHLSSGLWNILGDCYFATAEIDVAEEFYQTALQTNPRDVRAKMNLAYVAVSRGRHAAALRLIGEALALDKDGDFSETLLEKQSEAMSGLIRSSSCGVLRGANRMRGHYHLPSQSDPSGHLNKKGINYGI